MTNPTLSVDSTTVGIVVASADHSDGFYELTLDAIRRRTKNPSVFVVGLDDMHSDPFEAARAGGATVIVMLEHGTLPAHDDWLQRLTDAIDDGADLVGILGDPNVASPSTCIAVSTDVIDRHNLRFDVETAGRSPMSGVVEQARASGLRLDVLPRSSRIGLERFPGGLYGDVVYDHGLHEWARIDRDASDTRHGQHELADSLVLDHCDEFIDWMRGTNIDGRVFFVLGMHRSGTSALTSCLERCGLFLGEASRSALPDQPRGSFERIDAQTINDNILALAGGSWRQLPRDEICVDEPNAAAIAGVVAELEDNAPAGLKDPRLLLTTDAWVGAAKSPSFVGTFRHPLDVAKSLLNRNGIAFDEAVSLWSEYNERLVGLHRRYGFPLLEFDLSDGDGYAALVASLAGELGLRPRLNAVAASLGRPNEKRNSDVLSPVPTSCAATYEYLRIHRYTGAVDGDMAEKLLAWERNVDPTPEPAPKSVDDHVLRLIRPLPRLIRYAAWRVWSSARRTLSRTASRVQNRRSDL